jgi:uncharacterized protein YbcI
MSTNLPTKGQIERALSQRIQALYKNHLGHQPSKVTCELFADKLAIILEDSLTTAERVLIEKGQEDLAEQVRCGLDEASQPQLKNLIEEILSVKVNDILSDAGLETGRTGIIAILDSSPKLRKNNTNSQAKK